MFTKIHATIRFTAIFGLALAIVLSVARTFNQRCYCINGKVKANALNGYLEEQGIDEFDLTVDAIAALVECSGDTHYHVDLVFGPSGCFFDPPLELKLQGKYVKTGCHVWLYDETGEELEATVDEKKNKITIYVPHFSRYAFDSYNYY